MSETLSPESKAASEQRSPMGRRIMAFVLAILILLLALASYLTYNVYIERGRKGTGAAATDVEAGGLEWVASIYGTSNRVIDLFGQTVAAAPDRDGSLWITDAKTPALMHFTPDGRFLGSLNSAEASDTLQVPSRLTIGPDGLIYVCETALDMVRVLNRDGTDAGSFGIPQPVSVAVSEDRIAVGSVYGFALLDKTGAPVKVFGDRGKGDAQFDYVHGIAFDEKGNVYVADSYNNRLSAYDRDGKRLWIIKTGAPANSPSYEGGMLSAVETSSAALQGTDALQLPLGLTVDGAGRVVVSDMYDCALAVFDAKTGKFLGKYGDVGAEDGQFFYPVSVSYDPGRDWFAVADAFNKRVQIVRIPGSASGVVGATASVKRGLAGPLRACQFPFLLILLAIITWMVVRYVRRRNAEEEPAPAEIGGGSGDGR